MTSKERVKKAVHFEMPDRIPVVHAFLPGALKELGEPLKKMFRKYPSDFAAQNPNEYTLDNEISKRYLSRCQWTDEWGCLWDYPGLGVEGIPIDGPLYKSWERLAHLEMPIFDTERSKPADVHTHFVGEQIPGMRLFERMHFLRGFENTLMDIVDNAEEVYFLRDKITDWTIKNLKCLLKLDWIDYFWCLDDWGSQSSLLIPPEKWRKIFKPAYEKIFSLVRDAGKDLYFHSDGMIVEIIPDLIELGVTMLAPQFSCMQMQHLGKFKGQVCFVADIDRQHLLCFCSVDEIRQNVIGWINTLAIPEGGLIGRAEIGPGIPLENAEVAYKTFFEFRV